MESQPGNENQNPDLATNEAMIEEAEALIWALLDDQLETADLRKLEGLLKSSEQVRERYLMCVQMHVDLQEHFEIAKPAGSESGTPQSPVLGSLGDLRPGTDSWPPVAE